MTNTIEPPLLLKAVVSDIKAVKLESTPGKKPEKDGLDAYQVTIETIISPESLEMLIHCLQGHKLDLVVENPHKTEIAR